MLVEVAAALIYGDKRPATLSFQPLGGFLLEQVAAAITMVCNLDYS